VDKQKRLLIISYNNLEEKCGLHKRKKPFKPENSTGNVNGPLCL
jgi:hypothetical protein